MRQIVVTLTEDEAQALGAFIDESREAHLRGFAKVTAWEAKDSLRKIGTDLLKSQAMCARCGEYLWWVDGTWQDATCGEGCTDDEGNEGVHTP